MKWLKQQLRNRMLAHRARLDASQQAYSAKLITDQLQSLLPFQSATTIALYIPHNGEVATEFILNKIHAQQKQAYLPVLTDAATLAFVKWDEKTQLVKNRYGILEPVFSPAQSISPRSLDLVLTPLVAFDGFCNRLGMGKGYYDKTFAFRRQQPSPWLVGLAYEFQKTLYVPHTNLDIKLDAVITEKKQYGILKRGMNHPKTTHP